MGNEKISSEEFQKFAELIHRISGIYLKESKKTLLSNRLSKRMKDLELNSFNDYYDYVISKDKEEIIEVINGISTNETYFFRHNPHFIALFDVIIPEFISRSHFPLNIWCAGCSSGEEPYTIAMLAKERGYLNRKYIRIDASDINTEVLNLATHGIYDNKKFRETEPGYIKKYFKQLNDKNYLIDEEIRCSVNFFRFNLIHDSTDKKYDIIFCRNVMIYFDREDQNKVVANFFKALNPEGYFFLGHAESLYFMDSGFKFKKIQDAPVYYKE